MRLLTFSCPTSDPKVHRFGLVTADGSGVVDLSSRLPETADLGHLISEDRVASARAFLNEPADYRFADIQFERLLPWPRKIFCIGVNYGGRNAEYVDKTDASYPSVFIRFPDSFTGHLRPLVRPPESPQLDYEGEIVAIIGKGGRRIPVNNAREHIAGLTLGNEGTIRDWVRHAKFNVTQGKNWDSSGSLGPFFVPLDEIGPFEELSISTHVNGQLRQSDSPATMKYSIEYQVHYLSTFTTLSPGDIIFTGTPTGAGARFDPPIWLCPGDQIDICVDGIGTLSNTVADELEPNAELQGD